MGYTDANFDAARKVNSDTQLYKQAGNSIVVDVMEHLLHNLMLETYDNKDVQLNILDL